MKATIPIIPLHEALALVAGQRPSAPMYHLARTEGRWEGVTYGQFMALVRSYARKLHERGVREGDRVAMVAENRPEWTAAYTAIVSLGGVAVPADTRLTPPELKNILSDSESVALLYTNETEAQCLEALSVTESEGHKIATLSLDEAPDPDAAPLPLPQASVEDVAALLYTSGTTGAPKAVVLTHHNLMSDASALMEADIISGSDNILSLLPLHHTYAFMCTFLAPALLGAAITQPAALKGPEIAAACKARGVTIIVGVPQLLELMRNRIMERFRRLPVPLWWVARAILSTSGGLRRSVDLNILRPVFAPLGRSFRFFTSGGAKLQPDVMTDLEALGFTVLEGYGLTETSPIITFNPLNKRKPGSVGRPMPTAEIRMVPEESTGTAEITVRGPMVMPGYYNRPRETEAAIKDGWFYTGDLGHIDEDGYVFITGRKKEVIVLASGKNVYPEEVERHLLACTLIKEICVLEYKGRLRAVIVPDMEAARTRGVANVNEALKWEVDKLSGALAPHMRVMGYALRAEPLPRTPLGKLRRFVLRQEMVEGMARRQYDGSLEGNELGLRVAEVIKRFLPEDSVIRASDNLELDLGIDSLTRVEIVVALEKGFGLRIEDEFIARVHTVEELIRGLDAILAGLAGGPREAAAAARHAEGLDSVLAAEPEEADREAVGLVRGVFDNAITGSVLLCLKAAFRLLLGHRGRGVEGLPEHPYIIAANHTSYLDAFVIGTALPNKVFKRMHFVGFEGYFRGAVLRYFARLAHVIPIDPDANLSRALMLSAYCLRSGNSLCIFPEGGRSMDGVTGEFKKGIGILSMKLGVPVVPVYISGAHEALPKGAKWFRRFGPVSVSFGAPVRPADLGLSETGAGDPYQRFAEEVKRRVVALRG